LCVTKTTPNKKTRNYTVNQHR